MADSSLAVNFPGLPEYEQHSTTVNPTVGKDTTTKPVTPEETAAEGKISDLTQQDIALQAQQAEQRRKENEAQGQAAERQQFIDESIAQQRTGPEALAAKDYLDKMRVHVRDEQDKLSKMPPASLFADRTAWGKLRGYIGIGLAGLGDGMLAAAAVRTGHAPTSGNSAGEIIDRDLQRQREAIDRQKDSVVMARTGLKDADEARRALLADIELRGAQMAKHSEDILKARLTALKMDQVAIDNTKEVLDLKRKQAEHEAEFAKLHGTTVVNKYDGAKTTNETINRDTSAAKAGGGGVEADKNAANFAVLREHGKNIASKLPQLSKEDIAQVARVMNSEDFSDEHGSWKTAAGMVGLDPETGISPAAKAYLIDVRSAAEGLGRVQSGAAIGSVENKRFVRSLMPQQSDSPETLKTRADNILKDIDARGAYMYRPPRTQMVGGNPVAPSAPPASEYNQTNLATAKKIATDKTETRERRDRARAYIKAAAAKGVR